MYIRTYIAICNMLISAAVISEPDDDTVCEGGSTTFTCVLNGSMDSDDVQWYRLLKDASTTERVNSQGRNMIIVPIPSENNFTTILAINNATKSYTGYYWVRFSFNDVCNVSLTVVTSM